MPPRLGWRLTRAPFADLSGRGAARHGGRWNSPGRPVVYLSAEAALPVLEVLVHLDLPPELMPVDYVLLHVDLEPLHAVPGWLEDAPDIAGEPEAARAFGDGWLAEGRSPVLRVRSRLVPEAANLLLNPEHPAAARLATPTTRPFAFDPRLLRGPGRG